MTIVHIDTGLTLRGGQRQLLRLARGLAERGHLQTVVCPEASELARGARTEGHRVFELPAQDILYMHGIVQLRQSLLTLPAGIVHAHDGRAQTLSWLASCGLPVRRVASRRVTFLPATRIHHRWIYSRTCDAVIAVSQFVRQLLVDSGIPARRIEVIPDGVEIPEHLPAQEERAKARSNLNYTRDDFVVGVLGAATPEKGLDLALAAFAVLSHRQPRAKLVIMGDVPIDAQATLLGIAGNARASIRFLPTQDEVRPFFAALDLFWMPSRAEGLGSAALMAMAHGVTVVASRAGGLPEIVEEGKTGWLAAVGEPAEFAEISHQAASQPEYLKRTGENAHERARLFSTDIMVARTERLYRQLI